VNSFDDELLLKLSSLVQVPRTRLFTSRPDGAAAVRADGSLAFRLPLDYDSVAQDASGVVWLLKGRYQDQTLYAYFPRTRIQAAVAFPKGVYSMFRSPNGHVYVSNFDGLFELDSQPTARARMVHGPIRSEYWPVQGVGPDESLWVSTATEVVHVHSDGTMRVMRFVEPTARETTLQGPIPLEMAPDGAVWVTSGKIVRIDSNDRIQVLTLPADERGDVRFGPDSSLWIVARDARTGQSQGIVNFVPAATPREATPWPFKPLAGTATPDPFVRCPPPPPPPPTPTPPLPPKNGAVNFVYTTSYMVSSTSHALWGYWADRTGRLTPVRGAPFDAAFGNSNVTIDPVGRYLYVGTQYPGIFAYTIDAGSGTLRKVQGSPFLVPGGETTVVVDRSGRYAFAANLGMKNLTGYAIDGNGGALRPLAWSPFAMSRFPFGLKVNPQRDVAYAVTGRDIETFDTSGGALRLLPAPVRGGGMANTLLIDPRGEWAYLTRNGKGTIEIYGVDPRTGALMLPSGPAAKAGNEPYAMVTDPHRRFLYVTITASPPSKSTIVGYRIDPRDGTLRELPTSPYSGAPSTELTITPDGAFLYATNFSSKSISGFAIDPTSGALLKLRSSPLRTGDTPQAIVSCRRVGDRCRPTLW
jgi:6-phosphogluconolactonase (cycloisomerase 2 family)